MDHFKIFLESLMGVTFVVRQGHNYWIYTNCDSERKDDLACELFSDPDCLMVSDQGNHLYACYK